MSLGNDGGGPGVRPGMQADELKELGLVRVASPCSASWDEMQGDEVQRFCSECKLFVWDFARLTSAEARALLVEAEGRLCGRIFTREDGTVLTRDCPEGQARRQRKKVLGLAGAAALLGTAAVAAAQVVGEQNACPDAVREREIRLLRSVHPANGYRAGKLALVKEDPPR